MSEVSKLKSVDKKSNRLLVGISILLGLIITSIWMQSQHLFVNPRAMLFLLFCLGLPMAGFVLMVLISIRSFVRAVKEAPIYAHSTVSYILSSNWEEDEYRKRFLEVASTEAAKSLSDLKDNLSQRLRELAAQLGEFETLQDVSIFYLSLALQTGH